LRFPATAVTAAASVLLAMAALAGCSGPATPARTAAARGQAPVTVLPGRSYYLALGDSLSRGVQPGLHGGSFATDSGYPDRLYAALRNDHPGLRLAKLGCPGETSFTMIHGGICRYPAGSQLAAAEQFLRAHRGHVSLVTIDIGANDPNSCYLGAPLRKLPGCMTARLRLTVGDLRAILSGLRAAGGQQVAIIGMNYYVPELAAWLHGKTGKEIAVLIERLVSGFNTLLGEEYADYGAAVANVFGAFHSSDFTDQVRLPGYGRLPRGVATVCELTWSCAPKPRGPNEHPNDTGYAVIAAAFLITADGG
jgi:lysophospholipase L1-like esterase